MCASDTFKITKLEAEVERLKGLLATGAGCEEGYRQHYVDLLDKCESARLAAEEKAQQCEKRMFRYGEQALLAQSELDDAVHTRDLRIDRYQGALKRIVTDYAVIDCRAWRTAMREIQKLATTTLAE